MRYHPRSMTNAARPGRCRLDQLLVDRGLAESRSRAQAVIQAGEVYVDGQRSDKPGLRVALDCRVVVRQPNRFVSRGGTKLEAALHMLDLDVSDLVALDVGASTGGFTDCLLQRGASHVFAVDVGRGQLAWRLRIDPRVTCLERTDIRTVESLPMAVRFATIDVAFIAVRAVLPAVWRLVEPGATVIALIKPQFEAGRSDVGRGGVVRDPSVHRRVVQEVVAAVDDAGWTVVGALPSPITGADGNREFLLALRRPTTKGEPRPSPAALALFVDACLGGAEPSAPPTVP
ncbi:MAG: TlyA family RNA methyltransferase [Anaerolineae bacterium]